MHDGKISGLVLFHVTEKHRAIIESFLTSAVEELEGSVVLAEMGMLSMMDIEYTKESKQINSKAYTFDSEAQPRNLSGLEHFPYSRKSLTTEAAIPSSGGDLISDEIEHLLKLLEDVAQMLYWREEDEELIGIIHTMMDRLLDNDTAEIADYARHAIPHLHNIWCRNADDEGDSDEGDGFAALVHGTLERYATVCNSGPRRPPSSRREGLRPVCWMDGAS